MPVTLLQSGAVICDTYRYLLYRTWNSIGPQITWIMLNPSTADATADDPTIRRCIHFSREWGFGSLSVVNLFAYRAVSVRDMQAASDPIGPENDTYLLQACKQTSCLLVAWGRDGQYHGRDQEVCKKLLAQGFRLFCLGTNQDGSPKHPLYVRKEVERQCFL
jgi:hypothetical protein